MSHVFLTRTGLLLLGRSICGATAVVCLFVNLHQASVGDASSLSYLSAFFVVILSWLFLREHISRREWAGIAVVLVGVFLLQSPLGSSLPWSVMAVGLFGAFSAGLALLALREAAQKIPAPLIVWGLCFATAIFSALFLLFFPGEHWVWPGIIGSVFVFGVALLGLIGQVWLTHAYMRLPAPIASAITLSSVVWGVIFESAISYRLPGSGAMVSYAMILGGIFILHRRSPKPAKAGVPEVSC